MLHLDQNFERVKLKLGEVRGSLVRVSSGMFVLLCATRAGVGIDGGIFQDSLLMIKTL